MGGIGREDLQGDGRWRGWFLFSELLIPGPASAGVSGRAKPHYDEFMTRAAKAFFTLSWRLLSS